jgi:hypothetical protein
MKLKQHNALGIDALENGEQFTAEITKTYWTTTQKGTSNFHVQMRGQCREGLTVNLFHKLYNTPQSVKYANEWLEPFGVCDVKHLEDGDLVGHQITGRVTYRGLFHLVEVLSIESRPPIGSSWHDKYSQNVTAWCYAQQPPEGIYSVTVEAAEPLHPRDNRMRVGTRLACRIDQGRYEGNQVYLDVYEKQMVQGHRFDTEGIESLMALLRLHVPEHVRQVNFVGRRFHVAIWWPKDQPTLCVSHHNKFLKVVTDDEPDVVPGMDASSSEEDESMDADPKEIARYWQFP